MDIGQFTLEHKRPNDIRFSKNDRLEIVVIEIHAEIDDLSKNKHL